MNGRVAALKARGVKVLVVVHRAPAWANGARGGIAPPSDPGDVRALHGADRAAVPGADAWELWNEPDSAEFWAGGADPPAYAALLRAAYPAIKAAQPSDTVVTGGMVGNNMDFLAALYANGAGGAFDAVGVHTDTACLTDGPGAYYRDERGRVGRYTFSAYREVHAVMADHGDAGKPIWMTELGWSTQWRDRPVQVGEKAGTKPLGVSPRRAGALPARGVPLPRRRPAGRRRAVVRAPGHPRDAPRRRASACTGRRARRSRPPRAFRKLDRGIRPRRGCGGSSTGRRRHPGVVAVR